MMQMLALLDASVTIVAVNEPVAVMRVGKLASESRWAVGELICWRSVFLCRNISLVANCKSSLMYSRHIQRVQDRRKTLVQYSSAVQVGRIIGWVVR